MYSYTNGRVHVSFKLTPRTYIKMKFKFFFRLPEILDHKQVKIFSHSILLNVIIITQTKHLCKNDPRKKLQLVKC